MPFCPSRVASQAWLTEGKPLPRLQTQGWLPSALLDASSAGDQGLEFVRPIFLDAPDRGLNPACECECGSGLFAGWTGSRDIEWFEVSDLVGDLGGHPNPPPSPRGSLRNPKGIHTILSPPALNTHGPLASKGNLQGPQDPVSRQVPLAELFATGLNPFYHFYPPASANGASIHEVDCSWKVPTFCLGHEPMKVLCLQIPDFQSANGSSP